MIFTSWLGYQSERVKYNLTDFDISESLRMPNSQATKTCKFYFLSRLCSSQFIELFYCISIINLCKCPFPLLRLWPVTFINFYQSKSQCPKYLCVHIYFSQILQDCMLLESNFYASFTLLPTIALISWYPLLAWVELICLCQPQKNITYCNIKKINVELNGSYL